MQTSVQILLLVELVAVLIVTMLLPFRMSRGMVWAEVVLLAALFGTWAVARNTASERRVASMRDLEANAPHLGREDEGFLSSVKCRACHPAEYASWYASFHRTMTQVATPGNVVGDFEDVTLESRNRTYRLERRGNEFWAKLVDPDWERQLRLQGADPDRVPDPPMVERRIVMTTGSHHMQTYWVPSSFGREVYNFPFVFLYEQQRWIPREDVFLLPPGAPRFFALWNNSCIDCHSTAGNVGFDFTEKVFDSRVAELGIACEACHGPAAAHIQANQSPLRRYRYHFRAENDPTIVQPEHLSPQAASQVCGQCHSVSLSDDRDWLANGHRYRAGEDLAQTRFLVRPAVDDDSPRMRALLARDPSALETRFWSDGMVRVSGREFSGMIESACYRRGDLSCLSCHSMHRSDPVDQLASEMNSDAACLQCHAEYRDRIPEHTHHAAESSGSRCYNCHMPHTTYGLLQAIRSHWIDNPSVASSLETGRPNACNLCHLDRTLAWTSEQLSDWYAIKPAELDEEQRTIAASLLWLLGGDAGQRAIVAWHMGWEPALETSGRGWLAPFLSHLLNDPYSSVRYIAQRSLRGLPDFRRLEYDFLDPPAARVRARERVLDAWFALPAQSLDRTEEAVLIDARGNLRYESINGLLDRRNDPPMFLAE